MYAIMSFMLNALQLVLLYYYDFALLGFLPYNLNPAKVFMGDTGSLALGGIFCYNFNHVKPRIFITFVGLVFVIETLSVMLQVSSYKLTKKESLK